MKRIGWVIAAVVGLAAMSSRASAQTQAGGASAQTQGGASAQRQVTQQQGVLQVGEITIVGRVQKPIAAVDVAKIQPKLTLAELRQPFLDRIEEAIYKDPF
ncbi:MAG: hypothetical protein M3O36_16785 [Myxococcota bacterium]|nr:hypothetical protein [Myxococcota bacterium]